MNKPTLFSTKLPKLQLAWDATSLRALMFCPRFYQLTMLEGWRKDTTDLDFGILAHSAMEEFDKVIFAGGSWEDAQFKAVEYAIMRSGSYTITQDQGGAPVSKMWTPWGGRYEPMWKCSGSIKYKPQDGKKGSNRKCPYAFKSVWVPGHGPQVCGTCGSPTIQEDRWLPAKKGKDRPSLIRTVIWWCEELKNSPIKTLAQPNGEPMVEVNFQIGLPWEYHGDGGIMPHGAKCTVGEGCGERFTLCGYFDGGCSIGGENFVRERKTTGQTLGKQYWSGFSPNVQIDTYDLAVRFLPEVEHYGFRGVLIEAAQSLDSGSRFGYKTEYRTEDQRQEHLETIEYWLREAVKHAEADHWPMAKSQCSFCGMKGICSKERGKREMFLTNGDYKKAHWNPLEER